MDRNVSYLLDFFGNKSISNSISKPCALQNVQYVRVTMDERNDICEIPTSESGNLSMETLSAVFPGNN